MLLAGALGVAHAVRRDPAAELWLDRAGEQAKRLHAPVLAAWAGSAAAFAAARRGEPDAAARTDSSRSLARTSGLTTAEALVSARLAAASPQQERAHGVVIRCLGTFAIERDGETVALPPLRPLPRALLLLLALDHGRDVHREVLVDQLWPTATLDAATHRLHAAASSVRRCLAGAGLGENVLRRRGSAYSLCLEGAALDLAVFDSAVRAAARCLALGDERGALEAYVRALDVYQDQLLVEVGPAEWVVAERERLRVVAANTAYSAAQLSLLLRPPADALPLAQRATTLDPLRDSAWAVLAETQELMGDLGSAVATRREHALVSAELTAP
jgi:two-component SAPR family response regulator